MNDALSQFRDAIRAAGLEPPSVIEPGKFHRFPGVGKRSGNIAGWCKFFYDGLGGSFGDWSSGFSEDWQVNLDRPLSQSEQAAFKREIEETRNHNKAALNQQHSEAAAKALAILKNAKGAKDDHTLLVRRGVKAHGIGVYPGDGVDDGALIIPILSDGKVCSLQFISVAGEKRFLRNGRVAGGYFEIGNTEGAKALCIVEGFVTGATVHEATGYPVAVAFFAGNLEKVSKAMREKLPDLPIINCADDDADVEGNPGITKANNAALTIGAKVAIPNFGDNRPEGASDFNDMAALFGLKAVATVINEAIEQDQTNSDCWPDPLPLLVKIDSEPYPIDALPDTLRAAVEEVLAFTKAPIPLVASSALAALSLAVQAHADVKRAEKLAGPVGLFLLTIADSGERKSTCDGLFMQAIREYETEQAEAAKPLIKDHNAEMAAWDAKHGGIKDKIRQLAKSDKTAEKQEAALLDLEHDKPQPPRVPRLNYGDATPEALKWNLAKIWPSGGIISSEAGLVFGAHGMGKDSVMRNLATLNLLWDGVDIATERRTTDSFTVRGARLTMHLQVQEATLRTFFDSSGGLARGIGFLSRFLLAWPESTQGYRPFSDPPDTWPALTRFNQRIAAILNQEVPIDKGGALSPPLFPLALDTKDAWVIFHDTIENELRSGGELYDVRDVASKTADNAARIATLFQIFEHGVGGAIGLEAFEAAARIAAWHLNEALRFFGELALPEVQADAARLDSWLVDYCRREKTNFAPRREVQRKVTPTHLRKKAALDIALNELVEASRVRLVQEGRRTGIHINPVLLEGGN